MKKSVFFGGFFLATAILVMAQDYEAAALRNLSGRKIGPDENVNEVCFLDDNADGMRDDKINGWTGTLVQVRAYIQTPVFADYWPTSPEYAAWHAKLNPPTVATNTLPLLFTPESPALIPATWENGTGAAWYDVRTTSDGFVFAVPAIQSPLVDAAAREASAIQQVQYRTAQAVTVSNLVEAIRAIRGDPKVKFSEATYVVLDAFIESANAEKTLKPIKPIKPTKVKP